MKRRKADLKKAREVPLTTDDIYVLTTIYQGRLRLFLGVFAGLLLLVGALAWPLLVSLFSSHVPQRAWGSLAGFLMLFVAPFSVVFWKRVWNYRRDIASGVKCELRLRIVGKQYFPFTGQYFLRLDDVDYMHHEVERDTYEAAGEGSDFVVYVAKHSRYAFNMRARFVIM